MDDNPASRGTCSPVPGRMSPHPMSTGSPTRRTQTAGPCSPLSKQLPLPLPHGKRSAHRSTMSLTSIGMDVPRFSSPVTASRLWHVKTSGDLCMLAKGQVEAVRRVFEPSGSEGGCEGGLASLSLTQPGQQAGQTVSQGVKSSGAQGCKGGETRVQGKPAASCEGEDACEPVGGGGRGSSNNSTLELSKASAFARDPACAAMAVGELVSVEEEGAGGVAAGAVKGRGLGAAAGAGRAGQGRGARVQRWLQSLRHSPWAVMAGVILLPVLQS
ncbi:hypothetical protein HaLaN_06821 [Haematococcus lacustris]|uniref:Uncharacterized protein n=1 Tax=Haematococcus lacustris TaxID=44745 RepID=A0A699YUG2_HAELA|nr:hypothetical protein HaLaN_06821 [Haematococcus lacustris]